MPSCFWGSLQALTFPGSWGNNNANAVLSWQEESTVIAVLSPRTTDLSPRTSQAIPEIPVRPTRFACLNTLSPNTCTRWQSHLLVTLSTNRSQRKCPKMPLKSISLYHPSSFTPTCSANTDFYKSLGQPNFVTCGLCTCFCCWFARFTNYSLASQMIHFFFDAQV